MSSWPSVPVVPNGVAAITVTRMLQRSRNLHVVERLFQFHACPCRLRALRRLGMSGRALAIGLTLGWAMAPAPTAAAAQVPCAELAKLSLPEGTVTAAEEVPAGEYAP